MYIGDISGQGAQAGITSSLAVPATSSLAAASSSASNSAAAATVAGTSNMLSGNFVSADQEPSKYLKATLSSFRIMNTLANAEAESASSLLDAAGGLSCCKGSSSRSKYVEAALQGLKVERMARNMKNSESLEQAEPVLEEAREGIEEAAREATAPTGPDGEPLPGTTDEPGTGGETVSVPRVEAPESGDGTDATAGGEASPAAVEAQASGPASPYAAAVAVDVASFSVAVGGAVDVSV